MGLLRFPSQSYRVDVNYIKVHYLGFSYDLQKLSIFNIEQSNDTFSYDLQKLSIFNIEQSNDTVTPLKWVQIQ